MAAALHSFYIGSTLVKRWPNGSTDRSGSPRRCSRLTYPALHPLHTGQTLGKRWSNLAALDDAHAVPAVAGNDALAAASPPISGRILIKHRSNYGGCTGQGVRGHTSWHTVISTNCWSNTGQILVKLRGMHWSSRSYSHELAHGDINQPGRGGREGGWEGSKKPSGGQILVKYWSNNWPNNWLGAEGGRRPGEKGARKRVRASE
jgi:hypothetical protein